MNDRVQDAGQRLFAAIEIPGALGERIGRCSDLAAQAGLPEARWVRPTRQGSGGLHCTLRFLGQQPERVVARLPELMAEVVSTHSPVELALGTLGAFPARGKPRVLWLGLTLPAELVRLHSELDRLFCRELELEPEERGFSPHVTVARCREPWTRRDLESCAEHFRSIEGERFRVEHVTLFESELRPYGAIYHSLAELSLSGRAA